MEIAASATLFQRSIYVFVPSSDNSKYETRKYAPLFPSLPLWSVLGNPEYPIVITCSAPAGTHFEPLILKDVSTLLEMESRPGCAIKPKLKSPVATVFQFQPVSAKVNQEKEDLDSNKQAPSKEEKQESQQQRIVDNEAMAKESESTKFSIEKPAKSRMKISTKSAATTLPRLKIGKHSPSRNDTTQSVEEEVTTEGAAEIVNQNDTFATAKLSDDNEKNLTVRYVGPEDMNFRSFPEMAGYYLDKFCKDWNSNTNPSSYLIPKIFSYELEAVSDEMLENYDQMRGKLHEHNSNTNRRKAIEAEHQLYRAVNTAINHGTNGPFIAILNFKVDDARMKILRQVFPHAPLRQFSEKLQSICGKERTNKFEYDLLVISASYGFTIVEVKNSDFDFKKGPDEYKYGIKQLISMDAFLYLLQGCTKIPLPCQADKLVRRVIFTPKLSRARYEGWLSTSKFKTTLIENHKIIQIFEGDGTLPMSLIPHLFPSEAPVQSSFRSVYKHYVKFMIGISSVKKSQSTPAQLDLTLEIFPKSGSSSANSMELASRIIHGNTTATPDNSGKARKISLLQTPKPKGKWPLVDVLTPDQQLVLESKERYQVLVGLAGTGKTTLLQTKALECLTAGQRVSIITTKEFRIMYQRFFRCNVLDEHQDNYNVITWTEFAEKITKVISSDICEGLWEIILQSIDNLSMMDCPLYELLEMLVENVPEHVLLQVLKNGRFLTDQYDSRNTFATLERLKQMIMVDCIQQLNLSPSAPMYMELRMAYFYSYIKMAVLTHVKFSDCIRKVLAQSHLFIDDALFNICGDKMSLLALTAVMTISSTFEFMNEDNGNLIWIAYDPFQYEYDARRIGKNTSRLQLVIGSLIAYSHHFAVRKLQQVVRCSEPIFEQTFNDENLKWVRLFLKPQLAHKYQGKGCSRDAKIFKTANEAWDALKRNLTDSILKILVDRTNARESISIIFLTNITASGNEKLNELAAYLDSNCQAYGSVVTIDDLSHVGDNVAAVICSPIQVMSFQWATVITIVHCSLYGSMELGTYLQYFALSRAVEELREYVYVYETDEHPADGASGNRLVDPVVKPNSNTNPNLAPSAALQALEMLMNATMQNADENDQPGPSRDENYGAV